VGALGDGRRDDAVIARVVFDLVDAVAEAIVGVQLGLDTVRALGVTTAKRAPFLPDVPTMAEAGFAGVGTLHWQSMLAPAGTPKPVIDTLFKAIVEASKQPALKEAFDKQLVSIKVSESPDEAKTWLKGELDAWRKITNEVKIEMAE